MSLLPSCLVHDHKETRGEKLQSRYLDIAEGFSERKIGFPTAEQFRTLAIRRVYITKTCMEAHGQQNLDPLSDFDFFSFTSTRHSCSLTEYQQGIGSYGLPLPDPVGPVGTTSAISLEFPVDSFLMTVVVNQLTQLHRCMRYIFVTILTNAGVVIHVSGEGIF